MRRRAILLIANCGLAGCTINGAPSFELFGAFFPAWMFCAGAGIVAAAIARVILTTPRLAGMVPYQLSVCSALGVISALVLWLAVFR